MNALETDGLTKRYGPLTAVDSVSFSLAPGQKMALLGVNGAGKTTMIHMLTGLTRPSGGSAHIFGETAGSHAAKGMVGLSPQQNAVAPHLTVRENLLFMARIYGIHGEKRRADALMESLGLTEMAARPAKKLSGGYARRLSIAMALVNRPRLLFLDEPTLGLDVLARRELWRLIESLDTTLVLTTHYIEEAAFLADVVAVMDHGRMRAMDTPARLMAGTGTDCLENAFLALTEGGKPVCGH